MPDIAGTSKGPQNKESETVDNSCSLSPVTNGASENGVSSTSPEEKALEKNEWEILLAQGKRHLFVKDYPNAVAMLGDACAKMAELFGDLADECAEAYFNYGRALLELAREDSNVLGTEPEKEESEGDEEDGDEECDEKELEDNRKNESEAKDEEEENGEAEAKTEKEKDNQETQNEESPADETIDTTKEINEDNEQGGEKEDDVGNLQLAWEVLELAKQIFERQKLDTKLAETYLFLGEVGLESENYNGAIEDMKKCVEIQKQILPSDHRNIAETHFQLGVACSLCNEFDQAIEHFSTSSEILETRIKNLKQNGAPKEEIDKNPFYSIEKEIEEIESLLPEIKAKRADMEDFKQETIKSMMASLKGQPQSINGDGAGPSSASSTPSVANSSPVKPVTNISHLVRKKRKPEEEIACATAVKKACSDQVNN